MKLQSREQEICYKYINYLFFDRFLQREYYIMAIIKFENEEVSRVQVFRVIIKEKKLAFFQYLLAILVWYLEK